MYQKPYPATACTAARNGCPVLSRRPVIVLCRDAYSLCLHTSLPALSDPHLATPCGNHPHGEPLADKLLIRNTRRAHCTTYATRSCNPQKPSCRYGTGRAASSRPRHHPLPLQHPTILPGKVPADGPHHGHPGFIASNIHARRVLHRLLAATHDAGGEGVRQPCAQAVRKRGKKAGKRPDEVGEKPGGTRVVARRKELLERLRKQPGRAGKNGGAANHIAPAQRPAMLRCRCGKSTCGSARHGHAGSIMNGPAPQGLLACGAHAHCNHVSSLTAVLQPTVL